ncbi:MAG: hypothetical protein JOS17DRAFT_740708 [Linnemannia elongata]|nr:MAG: hypothetical protein JOS17DRAFT_740708 [Linnemannia elongata]
MVDIRRGWFLTFCLEAGCVCVCVCKVWTVFFVKSIAHKEGIVLLTGLIRGSMCLWACYGDVRVQPGPDPTNRNKKIDNLRSLVYWTPLR